MAAYLIFDIEVTDPEGYNAYRTASGPANEKYGGEFIVRGGSMEVLEGDWQPHRLVIQRFESMEQAKAWYNSPEYQAAREIRQRTARSRGILVEGV